METNTILIPPEEGMKYLGVGRNKMYQDLLKRKDFPCFKIGYKYYINKQLLQEWANNQCKLK